LTYKEQLLDPRWQKKRLEILERDGFLCQQCFDSKTTLHIHHLKYNNGDAWDIENEYLITLCKHCHSIIEYNKKNSFKILDVLKRSLTNNGTLLCVTYLDEDSDECVDFYKYIDDSLTYYLTILRSTIHILSKINVNIFDDAEN
jgi:hypothetical protein